MNFEQQPAIEVNAEEKQLEDAMANFGEAIENFPFLRGKMKSEILNWISENISLQGKMLPFYFTQFAAILFIRSGVLDDYFNSVQDVMSVDELYTLGFASTAITGQALIRAKDKLKIFLQNNGQ